MMMRRATPDSEALGSSEDERPWPSATSFGSLPRKENGVPGLGGGIWATQSRGSFSFGDARRMSGRDARLGAPNPAHMSARSANTPSPGASSDSATALPFSIPLQPTPKAGRSLSHSQGQREMPSGLEVQQSKAGMDRPSVLPLGLLNEAEEADFDTEEEELGGVLTQTASHPPFGSLQRTTTLPSQYESTFSNGNARRAETFDDHSYLQRSLDGRFDAAFGNLSLDQPARTRQWQTSLGWEDLPNINESRRHSLADIPTRRGSVAGIDRLPPPYEDNTDDIDIHNIHNSIHSLDYPSSNDMRVTYPSRIVHGTGHNDNENNTNMPKSQLVPHVSLEPHERSSNFPGSNSHRPRKTFYIVSFKCSRVGVFYLLDNTGLDIREGDMVIVEADRGQDLGTVQNAGVTQEEARTLLAKYGEEQYKWLMMFSRNNQAGAVNPNAAVYGEMPRDGQQQPDYRGYNVTALSTRPPRDANASLKPKAIKRIAQPHEVRMLREKEGNEAKAKRACQQKVYQHHLEMEILEAEFQWDWNKLIFYYYADHYVNFKELVNDLYKLYKIRLWMSAVNPASFSPNAINSPPSGVGPGALAPAGAEPPVFETSYQMQYGADPDPYGAVMPYQIGYQTYDPNFPAIPGISNSYSAYQPGTPGQTGRQEPGRHPIGRDFAEFRPGFPFQPSGNG